MTLHSFEEKGYVEVDKPRTEAAAPVHAPRQGDGCMKRNAAQHFLLITRAGREGQDKSHNPKARRAVLEVEANRLYPRREGNQERSLHFPVSLHITSNPTESPNGILHLTF